MMQLQLGRCAAARRAAAGRAAHLALRGCSSTPEVEIGDAGISDQLPRQSTLSAERRFHREMMPGREDELKRNRYSVGLRGGAADDGPRDDGLQDQRQEVREVCHLARERRWQEAVQIFAQVDKPNQFLEAATVEAVTRSMQVGAAQKLFNGLTHKSLPAYNSMITMAARLKHIGQAEELVKNMKADGLTPDMVTYTSLITAYGNAHEVQSVNMQLNQLEADGVHIDKVAYGAAMAAFAKAGDKAKTREILAKMDDLGYPVDVVVLNSLVVSCAKTRDETAARAALEEMKRRGHYPDRITYTSMMGCLEGTPEQRLEKAKAILSDMAAAGQRVDIFLYNAVFKIAALCQSPESAMEILAEMDRTVGRNRETAHILRDVQNQAVRLKALEQTNLRQAGLPPVANSASSTGASSAAASSSAGAAAAATSTGGETSAATSPAAEPQAVSANAADEALPEGWSSALDPNSGKPYFWKLADPGNTVTWERPK